jgi:hypothetical protein
MVMQLVVDFCVLAPPIALVVTGLAFGVAGTLLISLGRPTALVVLMVGLANTVEFGILVASVKRRLDHDPGGMAVFWDRVLWRYLFLGGVFYYVFELRQTPILVSGEARKAIQTRGFESQTYRVIRTVNRLWEPALVTETAALLLGAVLGIDVLLDASFRAVSATFVLGVVIWVTFSALVVRDAAARWIESPEGMATAMELFGTRSLARAEENYLRAAAALETTRGG